MSPCALNRRRRAATPAIVLAAGLFQALAFQPPTHAQSRPSVEVPFAGTSIILVDDTDQAFVQLVESFDRYRSDWAFKRKYGGNVATDWPFKALQGVKDILEDLVRLARYRYDRAEPLYYLIVQQLGSLKDEGHEMRCALAESVVFSMCRTFCCRSDRRRMADNVFNTSQGWFREAGCGKEHVSLTRKDMYECCLPEGDIAFGGGTPAPRTGTGGGMGGLASIPIGPAAVTPVRGETKHILGASPGLAPPRGIAY